MSSQPLPSLPSVLPCETALKDIATTPEQLNASRDRVTNPSDTPIFICALSDCNRLFPSRDKLMNHRKLAHNTADDSDIITWNH